MNKRGRPKLPMTPERQARLREANRLRLKLWRKANPEKHKAQLVRQRQAHRDRITAARAEARQDTSWVEVFQQKMEARTSQPAYDPDAWIDDEKEEKEFEEE